MEATFRLTGKNLYANSSGAMHKITGSILRFISSRSPLGLGFALLVVVATVGINRNIFFLSAALAIFVVACALFAYRRRPQWIVFLLFSVVLLFPGDMFPPPKLFIVDRLMGSFNSILTLLPNRDRNYVIKLPRLDEFRRDCPGLEAKLVIWGNQITPAMLSLTGARLGPEEKKWNQVVWVYKYPLDLDPGASELAVTLNPGDVAGAKISVGPEFSDGIAYWDALYVEMRKGRDCVVFYHALQPGSQGASK